MNDKNDEQQEGSGESFTKHQKAVDEALNEKQKDEHGNTKLDPSKADNRDRDRSTDTPTKKTGGGKQKNKGM